MPSSSSSSSSTSHNTTTTSSSSTNSKSKSGPYKQLHNPATLLSLLRQTTTPAGARRKSSSSSSSSGNNSISGGGGRGGGLLRMFKLFPLLTSGCKMVALLGRHVNSRRHFIADHATIGTIFGHRRGKLILAIQEDPHSQPVFVIELPVQSSAFHKEMANDVLRIAFESETRTGKRKLMEEFVWAVYCNGRKLGYSIRRKEMTDEECHVMRTLKGVSMGAGVIPPPPPPPPPQAGRLEKQEKILDLHDIQYHSAVDGEMTYLRARFERVVGSKDSEAMYMINPDASHDGPELSIFFVRVR